MTTRMQAGFHRPNYLVIAARCFTEVIRLHRKWIKDMPEYFDERVIAQRKREEEHEQWMREHILPVLDRVYGVDPSESPFLWRK